jgi:hypothetical protein
LSIIIIIVPERNVGFVEVGIELSQEEESCVYKEQYRKRNLKDRHSECEDLPAVSLID